MQIQVRFNRSPKIMQDLPQFLPEILALNVKLSLDVHYLPSLLQFIY